MKFATSFFLLCELSWCSSILSIYTYSVSAFIPSSSPIRRTASSSLSMGFFDDLFPTSLSTVVEKNSSPKVEVPPDFLIPEPKPLTITSSDELPSIIKSSAALAVRLATTAFVLGWKIDTLFFKDEQEGENDKIKKKYSLPLGIFNIRDSSSVLDNAPRPKQPLILYEYDASPFCKRVREMINILDLTVEYRPCPGARQSQFSEELEAMTGRRTVPYLIDPNTSTSMFESTDIINYLVSTYGPTDVSTYDKKALWPVTFEQFSIVTSTIAALLRDMPASRRQANARPDNEKMIPIQLWGYECSPFVRPVREKLCSLALPHVMVSCSRGSRNRDRLVEMTGRFQVPYLIDPNTNIKMFESVEICKYLDAVYTVKD